MMVTQNCASREVYSSFISLAYQHVVAEGVVEGTERMGSRRQSLHRQLPLLVESRIFRHRQTEKR
jgi:hypothetical protein